MEKMREQRAQSVRFSVGVLLLLEPRDEGGRRRRRRRVFFSKSRKNFKSGFEIGSRIY